MHVAQQQIQVRMPCGVYFGSTFHLTRIGGEPIFRSRTLWPTALLLVVAAPGTAQDLSGSAEQLELDSPLVAVTQSRSVGDRLALTTLGTVAGIAAMGVVGYRIDSARDVPSEDPGAAGFLIGGLVGSALGSALTSHLASDGERSLARRLLITGGISAVGLGLAWFADDNGAEGVIILSIPISQILSMSL